MIYRMDDVAFLNYKLTRVVDLFVRYQMPICLHAVPCLVSKKCVAYINQCREKWPHLIRVAQHGFLHANRNPQRNPAYEFGPTGDHYGWISKGLKMLQNHFGSDAITIFSPPWNRLEQTTIQALQDLGLSIPPTHQRTTSPRFHWDTCHKTDLLSRQESIPSGTVWIRRQSPLLPG